jgi:crotonobetainyl-CoA:carnitine CoA-transferase CaiB-like acyl-CoA transferase
MMQNDRNEKAALDFVRVLDFSESIAGQFCCRMLADYGADVTLMEPPEGSVTRSMGPFGKGTTDNRDSVLFRHLNLGKKSFVVDQNSAAGVKLYNAILKTADAVVAPAGFDRSLLKKINPSCLVNIISPFGETGPKKDWRGSEIIYQAMSGMMIQNGRRDREPLYGVGHRASYCTGIAAYSAILAALMVRERTGVSQEMAVDIAHTAASMTYPFALQYSYNGSFERRGSTGLPLIEVAVSDGWISIWIRANQFSSTCKGLGLPELIDDPRFSDANAQKENFAEFIEEVQKHVRNRNSSEIVAELQARRVVAASCYRPTQLGPDAPHLAARNYWRTMKTETGDQFALGPQFRMSKTPAQFPKPAPEIGQSEALDK